MPALTAPIILIYIISVFLQFAGLALIPATRGFTALWPTVGCISGFLIGLAVTAQLVERGVPLSSVTPMTTVALQLLILAVAIFVYGESASVLKIGLLVSAAIMIGVATRM